MKEGKPCTNGLCSSRLAARDTRIAELETHKKLLFNENTRLLTEKEEEFDDKAVYQSMSEGKRLVMAYKAKIEKQAARIAELEDVLGFYAANDIHSVNFDFTDNGEYARAVLARGKTK